MSKKEKPKKPEAAPAAEGAEGEAPAKKKMAGKTLVLFIILPAVLVLGGGGAAVMMLMGGGAKAEASTGEHGAKKDEHAEPKKDEHGAPAAGGEHGAEGGGEHGAAGATSGTPEAESEVGHLIQCESGDPCYYAMPKLILNIANTEGQKPPLMELELSLQASQASAFDHVADLMPRLKDQLISFLRELRVEELNGSGGNWALRRELLNRFNTVMSPDKIDAVLIEGMLIQ